MDSGFEENFEYDCGKYDMPTTPRWNSLQKSREENIFNDLSHEDQFADYDYCIYRKFNLPNAAYDMPYDDEFGAQTGEIPQKTSYAKKKQKKSKQTGEADFADSSYDYRYRSSKNDLRGSNQMHTSTRK